MSLFETSFEVRKTSKHERERGVGVRRIDFHKESTLYWVPYLRLDPFMYLKIKHSRIRYLELVPRNELPQSSLPLKRDEEVSNLLLKVAVPNKVDR